MNRLLFLAAAFVAGCGGCSCESAVGPIESDGGALADGGALTEDAEPRDPHLACGAGLRLEILETSAGVEADAVASGVGRLGEGVLVGWRERATAGDMPLTFHLSVSRGTEPLRDLALPWATDRGPVLIQDDSSVIVLASPGATELVHSYSRWTGGALSEARDIPLGLAADEELGGLASCSGRAAVVFLTHRDDDATGLAFIEWLPTGDAVVSEVTYPEYGFFGTWLERSPLAVIPTITSCVADAAEGLHVAVIPGGLPSSPVLVQRGASEPSFTSLIGRESARDATLARGPGGHMLWVEIDAEEARIIELGGEPREVASGALDTTGVNPIAIGASVTGEGGTFIYGTHAGMRAISWVSSSAEAEVPVRLSDLTCIPRDFSVSDEGVVRLFAACTVGVRGVELVEFELCGEASP